jgi:uncharacterized membrane protein YfcA
MGLVLYSIWGLVVGLTVGFTSIGTGILGGPGLILLFSLDSVMAVGTISAAAVLMMSTGLIQHIRHKNIEWKTAWLFALSSLPAAFFAAQYAPVIDSLFPIRSLFALAILLSIIFMIQRYLRKQAPRTEYHSPSYAWILTPLLGILLGAIMGLTGITGSLTVVAFLLILKLPERLAIGTTSFVGLFSLLVAAAAHIRAGHVDWTVFMGLTPGVILGALIGARFVKYAPIELLRFAVMGILVVAAVLVLL